MPSAPPSGPAAAAAAELVDMIPHLMQAIRCGMRGGRGEGLSVPQFRTLAMVDHHPGAALRDAAGHVGLGAPAMSVIVDGLVRRGLLRRGSAAGDRRRSSLQVTPAGQRLLARARESAREVVAARLADLSAADLDLIAAAARHLGDVFSAPAAAPGRARP